MRSNLSCGFEGEPVDLLIYRYICSGENFILVRKLRVCFKKVKGFGRAT